MKKISWLLVILLTLGIIFWVYKNISLPQIVCWDEGGYLWQGYSIHQALRKGDWAGFLKLTKSQFYYPFFQSWYLGITNFFEYTVNNARLSSLFLLLPTVILVWLIGKNLLPVFFTLASPLVLFYYSTALKEGLGTVLTLLMLILYFQGRKTGKWSWFLATGLIGLILTLTKYNYGLLVLAAIGLEALFWVKRPRWLISNFILGVPILIGLAYWISPPGYLNLFLQILQNKWQVNLYDTTLLGHLLYYPAEIVFSYSFSWLAGLFLIIGFAYGLLKNRQHYRFRVLSFLFLVNFILAEKHISNNQARFIFTSIPAFFLVGSRGITQLLSAIKPIFKKPLHLGVLIPFLALGMFILLRDLILLPTTIRPTGSHDLEVAAFYQEDYQNLDRFNFDKSLWPKIVPQNPEKIEEIFGFIFANVDLNKKISLVNPINEFPPDLFNFYFARNKLVYLAKVGEEQKILPKPDRFQEYLIVLEISPGSRFDTLSHRRSSEPGYASAKYWALNSGFPVIKAKEFSGLGVKVLILGK